jgi:2-oxo-4-hydroxy-4-carboxy-5-ureidoimidazoline decarboxylase
VRLQEFNELDAAQAEAALRGCADVTRWARDLAAARPYAARAQLVGAAAAHATWSDTELETALADHPRIGEQATGARAATSASEQAGVDGAARAAFVEANRTYEERFGRIYLVRAKGRTGVEMLDLLHERLGHDEATEREVTKQQLSEIALLRLESLIEEEDA